MNLQRMVDYSAEYTLSGSNMWYTTAVENGPPVTVVTTTTTNVTRVVTAHIDEVADAVPSSAAVSAMEVREVSERQETNETSVLYPGSALVRVTAFMTAQSVDLTLGLFRTHMNTQTLVRSLAVEAVGGAADDSMGDVEWAYMVGIPDVRDGRTRDDLQGETATGMAGRTGAAAVVGAAMLLGIVTFLMADTGVAAVTGGGAAAASLPRRFEDLPV